MRLHGKPVTAVPVDRFLRDRPAGQLNVSPKGDSVMSDSVPLAGADGQRVVGRVIVDVVEALIAVYTVFVAQTVIVGAAIVDVVVTDVVVTKTVMTEVVVTEVVEAFITEVAVTEVVVSERVVIRRVRFIGGGCVCVGARRAASVGLIVPGRCTVRGGGVSCGGVGSGAVRRGGSGPAEKYRGADTG